jgi:hypothetical protein
MIAHDSPVKVAIMLSIVHHPRAAPGGRPVQVATPTRTSTGAGCRRRHGASAWRDAHTPRATVVPEPWWWSPSRERSPAVLRRSGHGRCVEGHRHHVVAHLHATPPSFPNAERRRRHRQCGHGCTESRVVASARSERSAARECSLETPSGAEVAVADSRTRCSVPGAGRQGQEQLGLVEVAETQELVFKCDQFGLHGGQLAQLYPRTHAHAQRPRTRSQSEEVSPQPDQK